MPHPGTDRLRDWLRRHNRRVLILTALTVTAAVALWALLYFVVWWLFLLGTSVTHPLDYRTSSAPVARVFAVIALLFCFVAWLARRARPNALPPDHRGFFGHLFDLLLAVPRLTLSIAGAGGAAARLTPPELDDAWALLRRMDEAGHPIPIQGLPVDIPDPNVRNHIVLALQLSGLIEIRSTPAGPVLAFRNEEARLFAQEKIRLRF